ncbi:hypothetical protein A2U01_0110273, partial [Trifolium medium]|nr:hypothetical protein [Trifolium medium]
MLSCLQCLHLWNWRVKLRWKSYQSFVSSLVCFREIYLMCLRREVEFTIDLVP